MMVDTLQKSGYWKRHLLAALALMFVLLLGVLSCSKAMPGSMMDKGANANGEDPGTVDSSGSGNGSTALQFPSAFFSDAALVKAGSASTVIMDRLVALINAADKDAHLYVNIYQFDYAPVIDALKQAYNRGVILHLMVDSSKESSETKNAAVFTTFRSLLSSPSELVTIDNDNGSSAINHHKHMLFSRLTVNGETYENVVFTTSENFTTRELTVLEDAVMFSDQGLYEAFVDNWNKMAAKALSGMKSFTFSQYTTSDGALQASFFPARENGAWNNHYMVADFLDSLDGDYSQDTIQVGMDQWSDGQIAVFDKLIALHDKGAEVQFIIRNESDGGLGTKFLAKLHAYQDAGGKVLILPDDQIIHSKYMLVNATISGKKRKVVLVGSLNYINPATQHNNNLLLKIENESLFKAYQDNYKAIQDMY